jgi:hypothetical protein
VRAGALSVAEKSSPETHRLSPLDCSAGKLNIRRLAPIMPRSRSVIADTFSAELDSP